MFIGVLCFLSSCSKESLDGESGSATEAIKWAKTKGMIAGNNSMPKKPITREEAITMIYRVLKDKI